jgi:hypothetical protein
MSRATTLRVILAPPESGTVFALRFAKTFSTRHFELHFAKWNFHMPSFSSELPIEESTFLFCMIIELLIPLLIWLFWDLEQRRQRWLASRGQLTLLRQWP